MPYITPDKRKSLDPLIDALSDALLGGICCVDFSFPDPGDVNYAVTRLLCSAYGLSLPCYHDLNEAMGVLECVKHELYRRIAAPYEDAKAAENGDVFGD
jgi:hypothetical protein